ncbi:PP0621 family protein [Limnohabitans sp. Jir72]|uniref:PP0621 family protein n=1 Tax=Limnohabitans sp. Jir72 TaxID=1977909 RepID=UPI000D3983DF|nr:PP0621 family protein [Limnohabitans sp. Jir72]PUE29921.1 hypothetical protein B9Z52_13690 [Limnohabitans sp. Jir72]
MKFLFLLLVALVVIWAIKRSRVNPPAGSDKAQTASPTEMVACAQCGIHLPRAEGVSGQNGLYCSTEHRSAAHDSNPA